MVPKLILASGSPRRRELLERIGITPVVRPSEVEEVVTSEIPWEVVLMLSAQKAEAVAAVCGTDCVVLGADTVVAADGMILGKPGTHEEAYEMVKRLQGRSHQVYTGVTLIVKEEQEMRKTSFFEKTEVCVYPMTEEEIRAYAESEEPMDKAGAYGIQGRFAAYIQGISGDYSNVVGLPAGRVYQELKAQSLKQSSKPEGGGL